MRSNLIKKMAMLEAVKGAGYDRYRTTGIGGNNGAGNVSATKATVVMGATPNKQTMPLTEQQATMWVKSMKHSDGSMGELITMEQAKDWLMKKGYTGVPITDFYAIINAMKSDYSGVAKMFNIMNDDFYGELARAFIMDKDAKPHKTSLYREYVVM